MPLIVTPAALERQSDFYHQLAQLTSAGIGVTAGLEHLEQGQPDRPLRERATDVLAHLQRGDTFVGALRKSRNPPAPFDVALIESGEKSGRLDQCFTLLAGYYRERASIARQVLSDLAYPAFVLHMAIFIFPFVEWFKGGPNASLLFLLKTFGVLIPLWGGIFLLLLITREDRGEVWRARIEKFCRLIPVLGAARHDLALARLAAALEALINAGVTVLEAWTLAAEACGSPAVKAAVAAWKPHFAQRKTPGDMILITAEFPNLFSTQYKSGEISGKLDDTLRRLHRLFQEEGSRRMRIVAEWFPRILYLGVAAFVAVKVIGFYRGYFNQLDEVMK